MSTHQNSQSSNLRLRIIYVAFVAVIFLASGYGLFFERPATNPVYKHILMGTVVEITMMGGDASRYDKAARSAFDKIARLEKVFSSYDPKSAVSRISEHSGQPVKVPAEVITVVKKALKVARLSDGAFDPTVGAMAGIWGFSGEKKHLPTQHEVDKVLPLVNYRNVLVDEKAGTITLLKKGMTLNLGGVAKGYIVEQAGRELSRNGVTRAIIKAGGDMFLVNNTGRLGNANFILGMQDPRHKDMIMGEAFSRYGAVATSGDYERYFMIDGKRYCHILDPETGFPARRSRAATIVAKDPTIADALSTAVFVMGPKKGLALIESLDGVEGVIVDSDGFIHNSSGFKGRIFRAGSMPVAKR